MLTQLSTVKARLAIAEADTQFDALLTSLIGATGTLFETLTRRRLARGVDLADEFAANQTEICPTCYPVESVSQFELKTTDLIGWVSAGPPEYVIRQGGVISLRTALGTAFQVARVIYTGGYVLPGSTPGPDQAALPADLEHAAIEQVANWFLHRDKIGLVRNWPSGGVYQQFIQSPLLPAVETILKRHERWNM